MKYTPKQFVTVDILLFRVAEDKRQILLIQRLKDPFKDAWALPGGYLDEGEDLLDAALRELEEETSVQLSNLTQLKAYGRPDRDPRHHTISVAFWAEVSTSIKVKAQDDAKDYQWVDLENLPALAFDHAEIIQDGKNAWQRSEN